MPSKTHHPPISELVILLCQIAFLFAMGMAILYRVEPFSFIDNYVSDLGLVVIDNISNTAGMMWFSIGIVMITIAFSVLASLCFRWQGEFSALIHLCGGCFLFAGVSAFIMIFFPKDITPTAHFWFSMGIYAGYLPGATALTLVFAHAPFRIRSCGGLMIVELLLFGFYLLANVVSVGLPAAFFQKLAIAGMVISLLVLAYPLTHLSPKT